MNPPFVHTKHIRCAIYTRKSTEEGLEQEFNSLDAQREACAAYITSQKHEGWVHRPGEYNDGGFSGGTLDRPALRRLLDEVQAGAVDVIVVYKVDRLTRSLSDFARIVEVLDKAGASFVSVTQAFNTTTSMGRLTLNVLLSFAQFEREVTGERIRDKIAASKAKGMWMGGVVPLGYDVVERKLLPNAQEAATVRSIFERFSATASMLELQAELEREGVRSKAWVSSRGNTFGGSVLSRGALYFMLQNRAYVGEITHKGNTYAGEHPPIVERALFETVQAALAERRGRKGIRRNKSLNLLAGLLWHVDGRRLTPVHTTKRSVRYRYYVTPPHGGGGGDSTDRVRIPAGDLEEAVVSALASFLTDPHRIHEALADLAPGGAALSGAITKARVQVEHLQASSARRETVAKLLARVEVGEREISLAVPVSALTDTKDPSPAPYIIRVPCRLIRAAKEVRLVLEPSGVDAPKADVPLVKLIVLAHAARRAAEGSPNATAAELAAAQGYSVRHFRVLLRVGYLAPPIVAAILDGRHPPSLTREKLIRMTDLPHEWEVQAARLGFAALPADY